MHVPRQFLLGLAFGLLLAIGIFVALLYTQLGVRTYASKWAYDIMQKKQAVASAVSGPRLLIIGGSGTTFGLNAQRIEEQTGVRTFNMGTHAGLGLDYILYWAKKVSRPGDTVLLIPEYELYLSDGNLDPHDSYILSYDPGFFRNLSWWEKIQMATRVPFKRIQKGFAVRRHPEGVPRPHPPYTDGQSFLTDHGDETGNPEAQRPPHGESMDITPDILIDGLSSDDALGFNMIREFAKWAKANHVTVLATFPNIIHRAEYDAPKAQMTIKTITDFYASLGIPVVGTAQAAMLPENQFFDTYYHLTREAAVKRTDRLVPALKPYLHPGK